MRHSDVLVHEEWASILVPSSHGEGIHYRVSSGTVNWSKTPDGMRPSLTVFMQYGSCADFQRAKTFRQISFDMPAHILKEDLPAVLAAMSRLGEGV